jgi:nickel/cobalt exporter
LDLFAQLLCRYKRNYRKYTQCETLCKKYKITFILITILFTITALAVLVPIDVKAHPHCFILNSVRFVFDPDGLAQIRIDWQFDEFFTGQILADCDKDSDWKLDDEEKACVKLHYFDNLVQHNFFTFIRINGRLIETSKAEHLKIALIENKLMYQFTVPCRVSGAPGDKDVRVAIYDPTFYCAMNFPDQLPVLVENEGDLDYSVRVYENKNEAYYYDQIHPWEARLVYYQPVGDDRRTGIVASSDTKEEPAPPRGVEPESSPESVADQVSLPGPSGEEKSPTPEMIDGTSETDFNFKSWIFEKQRILYEKMAVLSREIKEKKRFGPIALLLGIAFLYGLIHAAGPGHGKAFATSFVLAKGPDLKQALVLGNMIALFHGLSAVVLVILIKMVLVALTGQAMDQVEYITKIASYGLIALIGLFLFSSAILKHWKKGKPDTRPTKNVNLWVMALTIGLVPCPGVVLVLLFSISLDMLWMGILMAVFQTAGMALTISIVTVLVTGGRQGGLGLLRNNEKAVLVLESTIEMLAGLSVLTLGIIFLWATIS